MAILGKISLHNLYSCSLFNRNEAHGIFANKDLFAVDEAVQREALKNFYDQRAGVKLPDAKICDRILMNIRWRKRS